jgi:ubiquinone/menaquinone biosynthesis C-methylase UbiE
MRTRSSFTPALGYHWLTGLYDAIVTLTMPIARIHTRLVDILHPQADERILDFGFGTAAVSLSIKERMPDVVLTGVDIDPNVRQYALRNAERKGVTLTLDLYDGGRLPYDDATFDKVVSSLVFHHLDAATKLHCLQEIQRILKPTGILVVGDWGKPSHQFQRWLFLAVQLFDGFSTTGENLQGLLPESLKTAGFTALEEYECMNTALGTYRFYKAQRV